MAPRILPDAAFLRQIFDYDPETGSIVHKERPKSFFKREADWKSWNTRRKGKSALVPTVHGYFVVPIGLNQFPAHRVAFKLFHGIDPPPVLDHANGIRNDNRISNIRPSTQSQNMMNKGAQINSKTGVKGVSFEPVTRRYKVNIRANGKLIHVGRFETIEQAGAAYEEASRKLHGEFAFISRPPRRTVACP